MNAAVGQKTEYRELERARAKLSAAQARTKNQQGIVERCREELASKRGLRERVKGKFDECCLRNDGEGARRCQTEMDSLDITIRGCELRLSQSKGELQKVQEAESAISNEVGALIHQQNLVKECEETAKLIEDAEQSYLAQHEAVQHFTKLMEELKKRTFLDPDNKRQASDAHFRLTSLFNGYNWHKPPAPKKESY